MVNTEVAIVSGKLSILEKEIHVSYPEGEIEKQIKRFRDDVKKKNIIFDKPTHLKCPLIEILHIEPPDPNVVHTVLTLDSKRSR